MLCAGTGVQGMSSIFKVFCHARAREGKAALFELEMFSLLTWDESRWTLSSLIVYIMQSEDLLIPLLLLLFSLV
jgi:hypothetical protein